MCGSNVWYCASPTVAWLLANLRCYGAPAAAPAKRPHQPHAADAQVPLEKLRLLLYISQRLQTGIITSLLQIHAL